MAKRFIDTGLFQKVWFRKLSPEMKAVWLYLFTNCDHAGIIDADYELLSFMVGAEIKDIGFNGNVIEIKDKWYLTKFVEFQYGKLNPDNRVHQSVINRLNKFELLNIQSMQIDPELHQNKPLISPLQGCKDKDKDKDKEKDKDNGANFEKFWVLYDRKVNKTKTKKKWMNLSNDDRAAIFKSLPDYIKSTPDKTFRKHPMTYLNNRSWEDEIVTKADKPHYRKTKTGMYVAYCSKCGNKEFPGNDYQLRGFSGCCSAEYMPEDPNNNPEWVKRRIKHEI